MKCPNCGVSDLRHPHEDMTAIEECPSCGYFFKTGKYDDPIYTPVFCDLLERGSFGASVESMEYTRRHHDLYRLGRTPLGES